LPDLGPVLYQQVSDIPVWHLKQCRLGHNDYVHVPQGCPPLAKAFPNLPFDPVTLHGLARAFFRNDQAQPRIRELIDPDQDREP